MKVRVRYTHVGGAASALSSSVESLGDDPPQGLSSSFVEVKLLDPLYAKVYFIRHGESVANKITHEKPGLTKFITKANKTDAPLTEKGIAESMERGRLLQGILSATPDVVMSSVLRRAIQTAFYMFSATYTESIYVMDHLKEGNSFIEECGKALGAVKKRSDNDPFDIIDQQRELGDIATRVDYSFVESIKPDELAHRQGEISSFLLYLREHLLRLQEAGVIAPGKGTTEDNPIVVAVVCHGKLLRQYDCRLRPTDTVNNAVFSLGEEHAVLTLPEPERRQLTGIQYFVTDAVIKEYVDDQMAIVKALCSREFQDTLSSKLITQDEPTLTFISELQELLNSYL